MVQVVPLIEMLLHTHQGSTFQSFESHHPIGLLVLMKWLDLLHEGEMALQKEIPEIDPRYGFPLKDEESHHRTRDMSFHG
jgi:hypothetical protein